MTMSMCHSAVGEKCKSFAQSNWLLVVSQGLRHMFRVLDSKAELSAASFALKGAVGIWGLGSFVELSRWRKEEPPLQNQSQPSIFVMISYGVL